MKETLIYDLPNEPEGYGAFDNQDEVEIESSWCFMCGDGENHQDIKLCKPCYEYLNETL